MNKAVMIYWSFFALIILTGVIINYMIVIPELRRHGAEPKGWFHLTLNELEELKEYKRICERENKPLTWYKASIRLMILSGILLVGWVVLVFTAE